MTGPLTTLGDVRRSVIVGVAGHIDHGKTRLVRALTGIDTDRLPEEKRRGISIDLGFAQFESSGVRVALVDVPGHERFLKNMIAGATGVTCGLLVVAADDGVMPQTREHLDVMQLLGVPAGVIAITKCDLADAAMLAMVEEETAALVAGTFLEAASMIRVSAVTGHGIEALREQLILQGRRSNPEDSAPLFRMPIDRVFTVAGHGVVVTGSSLTGVVHPGDELELLPEGRRVRVRGVQSHGQSVGVAGGRQRLAINLANARKEELRRGMELATPGFLTPTHRLIVELTALPSSSDLRHRMTALLHLGTSETRCRIIRRKGALFAGETGAAELRTERPVVAAWGQRFVLRRLSPPGTIAGGRIIDPAVPPRRIRDLDVEAEQCGSGDERVRLSRLLRAESMIEISATGSKTSGLGGIHPQTLSDLERMAWTRAGLTPESTAMHIENMRIEGELLPVDGPRGTFLHRDRWEVVSRAFLQAIRTMLKTLQPRRTLTRREIDAAGQSIAPAALREAVRNDLLVRGELVVLGGNIGPADAQPLLTKRQQRLQILAMQAIEEGGLMPPTVKELSVSLGATVEELMPLLELCAEENRLIWIEPAWGFAPESLERGRQVVARWFESHAAATLSQLREAWGVTRKYAFPLCGWYDARQVTIRESDLRRAGPNLGRPLC